MTDTTPAGLVPAPIGSAPWWAPQNLQEAMRAAELIADSGMVPNDYIGKPGAVLVAMQMGSEIGLSPMAAIQNIAVINGRPSLWGDAMLAVCKSHRKFVSCDEKLEGTSIENFRAVVTVQRRDEPAVVRTFSVKDAERAGLWKKAGPWSQYPQRMLIMRARAWALRDSFPDALRGIYSAEEAEDLATADAQVISSRAPEQPATGVAGLKARLAAQVAPAQVVTEAPSMPSEPAPAPVGRQAEHGDA